MFRFSIKSKLGSAIATLDTHDETATVPIEWSGNDTAQTEIKSSLLMRHGIVDECSCLDLLESANDELNSPHTRLFITIEIPEWHLDIVRGRMDTAGQIPIDDSDLILSALQAEAEGDHGDLTEVHS